MAQSKAERLLQLVLCLGRTRRYVTKDQLRAAIPDYAACPTVDAFERMFERDKSELREMGVPLETGVVDAGLDEPGYRIDRDAYALPDLHLTPDELTAVAVAARVWGEQGLGVAAAQALRKLEAEGVSVDTESLPAVQPRLSGGEAAFGPLTQAVARRRVVSFDYRASGDPQPRRRHLEPWAVVSERGRWYVVGHDRDRAGERVFRLSRIDGPVEVAGSDGGFEVPADVDARARVSAFTAAGPAVEAILLLRSGAAHGLRQQAVAAPGEAPDGYERVSLRAPDLEGLARSVATAGSAVVVVSPPELRDAVLARLRGVLTGKGGSG